jgi:hypothetical protein
MAQKQIAPMTRMIKNPDQRRKHGNLLLFKIPYSQVSYTHEGGRFSILSTGNIHRLLWALS